MLRAGLQLLRDSGRVLLERAPAGLEAGRGVHARMRAVRRGWSGVHDLHVWEITSGEPALSAHVLVEADADCHAARLALERMLVAISSTCTTRRCRSTTSTSTHRSGSRRPDRSSRPGAASPGAERRDGHSGSASRSTARATGAVRPTTGGRPARQREAGQRAREREAGGDGDGRSGDSVGERSRARVTAGTGEDRDDDRNAEDAPSSRIMLFDPAALPSTPAATPPTTGSAPRDRHRDADARHHERHDQRRVRMPGSAISAIQSIPIACERQPGDDQRALADRGRRARPRPAPRQERDRPGKQAQAGARGP